MAGARFSPAELTQFGLRLEDEGPHSFDPAVEWWNESWFWDWFDATGSRAGHCRIGVHPNQHRAWLWFYLLQGDEWISIEEPRLPLADWDLSRLAYDGDPQFKPIENTAMQYATNTQDKVFKVGDLYYLCYAGVWFM